MEIAVRVQSRELTAKALDVSKNVLINDADQAEQFKERVLERSGGQEQFVKGCKSTFDCIPDLVRRFVDIPKSMSFINHGEVPSNLPNVWLFGTGKLVGADDDLRTVERVQISRSNLVVESLGLQNY